MCPPTRFIHYIPQRVGTINVTMELYYVKREMKMTFTHVARLSEKFLFRRSSRAAERAARLH